LFAALAMCTQCLKFITFAGLLLRQLRFTAGSEQLVDEQAALLADNECVAAPGGQRCDLSALQMKGSRLGGLGSRAGAAQAGEAACHDALPGERCFKDIRWAKRVGIREHPGWYPRMSSRSSDQDFQWVIHETNPSVCPRPCGGERPPRPRPKEPKRLHHKMPEVPADPDACLCVFDIDRTLTSRQGSAEDGVCPKSELVPGVEDNAYGGGTLTLSDFAQNLKTSACADCYIGLCSHGNADFDFSKERTVLLKKVMDSKTMQDMVLKPSNIEWSDEELLSPYVVYSPDGEKQKHVAKILRWYRRQGIHILKENTFFFDDRADNVLPFEGTGMNARQISCGSRDMEIGRGVVGLCGAVVDEVVKKKGVAACPAPEPVEDDVEDAVEAEAEGPEDTPEIDSKVVDAEDDRQAAEAAAEAAFETEALASSNSEFAGPE